MILKLGFFRSNFLIYFIRKSAKKENRGLSSIIEKTEMKSKTKDARFKHSEAVLSKIIDKKLKNPLRKVLLILII